jgi:hypothetical protein
MMIHNTGILRRCAGISGGDSGQERCDTTRHESIQKNRPKES